MSGTSPSRDGREKQRTEDQQEPPSGGGGPCGTAREGEGTPDGRSQTIQVGIKKKGTGPLGP